ncbi:LysR family transcriptional regulator [Pseudomonas sp. 10B1]|uniref:LysR substrate-binding domain-containing protein n=1 Tax=unclassified Pseudomonas TaxID=196821 RepID=UPI002AB5DC4C|nr:MULTISPECIES: LysR family transcriptional regulator [unclassified Pseudomonas]MDY7560465.1 LysR family transcriptional regulator [Pseudomonas sp. AB6]MEA9975941.1 LysR family transcriptional regulator [Pseudomonas sp. RTS4]MEA9993222.1 LysR family transcriptional regulator [Pseudomonas sp. AA4]MEB0088046.1 LysR family transcriptional regulator [Pseudomonas sp. RTI1]MEB0124291.1 LysR family transcriptional regulator [Pseudomonas sp. CCC1.2]
MNQLLAMRAFVRVIETGSFSRASEHLALPRSTVSKLITDLEKHLGIRLIQRTTRALTPTSDGLDYHRHALRIVAELDEVDSAVRGRKLKAHGHLRVDAPASFANCLLIPALVDFHREYPDITIALGISDRAVNLVGEGVDCVIRAGKPEDMTMISRKITALEYITCAAPSYLKRMGTPLSPDDLQKNHLRAGYFFTSNTLEPLIFQRGTSRYEVGNCAFTTNEGNGLKEMLLAGMGVGQHFQAIVQHYIDEGRLVPLLQDWSRPAMPLQIMYPPNRHQNARLKVFIDWVIQRFGVTG